MARRDANSEAFWRFSLMVYARPGIADALIGLQDSGAHNVNLILFGLWLGIAGGARLDAAVLDRATAAMAPLDRDIVRPLRAMRRGLKPDPTPDIQALRRRLLALEIAAERQVQTRLAASVSLPHPAPDRKAAAEANLRLILGSDFGSAEAATLVALIAGF
jgi:uncharacterized protein (TIGR02444 family)